MRIDEERENVSVKHRYRNSQQSAELVAKHLKNGNVSDALHWLESLKNTFEKEKWDKREFEFDYPSALDIVNLTEPIRLAKSTSQLAYSMGQIWQLCDTALRRACDARFLEIAAANAGRRKREETQRLRSNSDNAMSAELQAVGLALELVLAVTARVNSFAELEKNDR